ncbi:MAG: hypothetical protein R2706_06995 [Acidimicrobiales bacterium]
MQSDNQGMQWLWKIWLGAAATVATAYFVIDNTPTSKLVLYNGLGLFAVAMILVGVKHNKPDPREPWLWFAAGLGSFLVADVIYYIQELTLGADKVPYPSWADPFYLGVYPLLIIGLTKMVKELTPGRDKASFIDAAIVGIAMFGCLWILFVDTVWATEENTTLALTVQLAAPILDLAVLAVATRVSSPCTCATFPLPSSSRALAAWRLRISPTATPTQPASSRPAPGSTSSGLAFTSCSRRRRFTPAHRDGASPNTMRENSLFASWRSWCWQQWVCRLSTSSGAHKKTAKSSSLCLLASFC